MTYTLFGQPASPATIANDANGYTMGVQFTVTAPCVLNAFWFFSASTAGLLPATVALYTVSGSTLVHSETSLSWSGSAGSGWVRAALATPQSLVTGTAYKGCVSSGPVGVSNWYSSTAHYWDTGTGANGLVNGPLSAPDNAAASVGQDTFNVGNSLAFPSTAFNASNYWVDVEVALQFLSSLPLMARLP